MPLRSLVIAFVLCIACFFASTLYSQYSSRAIDAAAARIATNAMPSIERISGARAELRRLWIELERYRSPKDDAARIAIETTRARVDKEVEAYLALPTYPGERELWGTLHHDLSQADRAIDAVLGDVADGPPEVDQLRKKAEDATEHAIVTLRSLIDFDARQAAADADEIGRARQRTDRIAITLDAISALLTLLLGWLAVRTLRQYDRLLEERNRLQATRAEELEQFAGRVAHDVLGPLSATSVAIQLARRRVADEQLVGTLDRGSRGLDRVKTIVDGLLRFARAGAQPEPGVRTRIRPVVDDLVSSLAPLAAENDVTVVAERIDDASVASNTGVLTSLLENLVRNAIKYMTGTRERRVTVRALSDDQYVRVEVQDTGPGIPAELLPTVFQPYVRGKNTGKPGIGLGLATVRRIVEAHGGTVGVESSASGCLFWFTLPRTPAPQTDEPQPSLH